MNAFEQLEIRVPGPHQAFEDVVAEILIACGLAERRIRVHRGDGGVDAFYGRYSDDGGVTVFQAKYFLRPWGTPRNNRYATPMRRLEIASTLTWQSGACARQRVLRVKTFVGSTAGARSWTVSW